MTLFADVVSASAAVAGTSSRSAKVAILAELLRALEPEEVPICVGLLSGVPRQGRVGIGYAAIRDVQRAPAAEPSLTVADVDRAISEIEAETGSGSASRRRELLQGLMGRATEPEARFLVALLTGGLRQGALAGLIATRGQGGQGPRGGSRAARSCSPATDPDGLGSRSPCGEAGLKGGRIRAVPADPADAGLHRRQRGPRRWTGFELRLGGVQARRDPHPDPLPWRRGADLHAQPQRDHRHAARDRRRGPLGCR